MIFAGDFETTVYEGQTSTRVWSSALTTIEDKQTFWFPDIQTTLDFLASYKENHTIYYHNLKFDGKFFLSYLLNELHFESAYKYDNKGNIIGFQKPDDLKKNQLIYSISSMGQWYTIVFHYKGHNITLKDSYKLLPFKLSKVLHDFKTEHQKLEMDYEGYKGIDYVPTEQEKEYIQNDVIGLAEALEIMFDEGHDKLTIGSCCMAEFKRLIGRKDFAELFPRLDKMEKVTMLNDKGQICKVDMSMFEATNVDEYIRHSYRGGWVYRVDGGEYIDCEDGTTADVNSLYPSMMSSESESIYPFGKPFFWKGNYIPKQAYSKDKVTGEQNRYFFIRFKCRFAIKENKLPFVQIKKNSLYRGTEMLKTSNFYNKHDGHYYRYWIDKDGNKHDTVVELTMTCTDWILFKEHYNIYDLEILDGCFFYAQKGMFDLYIDKYKEIKQNAKGAQRTIAKLFLNNLYGKFATSTVSAFKIAVTDGDLVQYKIIDQHDKEPVFIAVGSAITSYSRNFTIRAAQANYHGKGKRGFKYADTDSIHCDLPPDKIVGIKVHPTNFCCWKLESCWDYARFVRPKTYVEHVTHEDLEAVENPYYNIKCAGMPDLSKNLFLASFDTEERDENGKVIRDTLSEKEKEKYKDYLSEVHTIDNFKKGMVVPGKLLPVEIPGGVVLYDSVFTMNDYNFI